ncbi:hypothetical protein [Ottowia sp.]|uniref:hypothetical protein n=1 Tax=Ottowia sp. TaxID=1898956 RepID=UPI002BE42F0B|nr:hypothetical protein [Ottowia sp.]HOB65830.1 hypothetical protein [Ottowia sp.]HPZ57139.1 hypothetical protein [Ottowia sp.]HQD46806.1 hypothetical protein [Ottowia sp.]
MIEAVKTHPLPALKWSPLIGLPDGTSLVLPCQDSHAAAILAADTEADARLAQGSPVAWTGARRHIEAGDFSDPRVMLTRPGDPRCGRLWREHETGFEQGSDGPTLLVIGRQADDAQLARMAQRFGVPLTQLQAFRGVQV